MPFLVRHRDSGSFFFSSSGFLDTEAFLTERGKGVGGWRLGVGGWGYPCDPGVRVSCTRQEVV